MDGYESLYMYLVEGVDSNGDPVQALVTASNEVGAKAKVRREYEGRAVGLKAVRVTGQQWDELLRGYGTRYGPINPQEFREDYSAEAHSYAITEGRPIFL